MRCVRETVRGRSGKLRPEGARIPPSAPSRGEGTKCVQLRTLPSDALATAPAEPDGLEPPGRRAITDWS